MTKLALLGIAWLACGCLYVEAGGGVYRGAGSASGTAGGWSWGAGIYGEFGRAKGTVGGGGTIVHHDGDRYIAAGASGKLDVTFAERREPTRATMLRGTAQLSYTNATEHMVSENAYSAWAVFLGATVGHDRRVGPSFTSELWSVHASLGLDIVRSEDVTFLGPSVRVGAGTNVVRLVRRMRE